MVDSSTSSRGGNGASDSQVQLRLLVAYDGREYFGWQRNPARRTVQGTLEATLSELFGCPVRVRGAGRTDRGAHAAGQVACFTLSDAPSEAQLEELRRTLVGRLPNDLHLRELDRVPIDFHPRESAIGKRYRYEIWQGRSFPPELEGRVWRLRRPVRVEAMRAVLPVFLGRHDFSTFASPSNFERRSSVRNVERFELETSPDRVSLAITADAFLYKMVRNIVAAVVKAGEGKLEAADIARMLAAADRSMASGSAPASGLVLDEVFYPEPFHVERGLV